jgi:uridine kinase
VKLRTKANTFTVQTNDGRSGVFLKRTAITEILDFFRPENADQIVLGRTNHRLSNLNEIVEHDCRISWIPIHSPEGLRAYQMTLCLVLIRAVSELFPKERLLIDHSIGKGFFCEFKSRRNFMRWKIRKTKKRMEEIVLRNDPIMPVVLSREQIKSYLEQANERGAWFIANGEAFITLYQCGNVMEYFGYPLLSSTGQIKAFDLVPWHWGMILRLPEDSNVQSLPPFVPQKKIFRIFHEYGEWEKILGIQNAEDLNRLVSSKSASDLVKIAESLHEKKVAYLADMITRKKKRLRLILIAGPSSSGKTTFMKRLSIQLRVNGQRPLLISLDDYFLDRNKTPVNGKGKPDYEALEAINITRFNSDLAALLEGVDVELPRYDFKAGVSVSGSKVRLEPNQPVLIEGLHALNGRLTETLPDKNKLKIYISALTQLNLTDHLRVPTSDIRFLRRLVRDAQFRGHSVSYSLATWPLVREGEEKYIFPFQEESHIIFNSALTYEPSILRVFSEPLLGLVPRSHPEYPEACRLIQMLRCFKVIPPDEVPPTSILREFIGGSSFQY